MPNRPRIADDNVAPLAQGLDALRVGLAVFDTRDVLVYCNEHFRYVYRSLDSVDQVVGLRFEEIERLKIAQADLAGGAVLHDPEGYVAARLARRGRDEAAPFEERLSDGRWIHVKERPLPGGGAIALYQDVTALKAAEGRLLDALDSMPDGFLLWDQCDRLVHMNERFRQLVGDSDPPAMALRSFADVMQWLSERKTFRAAKGGGDWRGEWRRLRRAAGGDLLLRAAGDRWIALSERRARDGGTISVFSDITELKVREQELIRRGESLEHAVSDLEMVQSKLEDQGALLAEQVEETELARREVARANDGKINFLRAISHELRSPLNAIIGFADLMQAAPYGPLGNARYRDYLGDIHASGRHLLSLVNQLLDLSRMEVGHHRLELGWHAFSAVYDSAWRIVGGLLQGSGLAYEADLAKDLPEMRVDPQAVRQILVNVLSNAIKFTPEGGTVRLCAKADGETLVVAVADSGIGIPPQAIPRLMRPFERSAEAQDRQIQGSGLGLAISRSLVELHGGRIEIESDLGGGTTVTIRLPVAGPGRAVDDPAAERRLVG